MDIPINLERLPENLVPIAERFWESLWQGLVYNRTTSLPYWADTFQDPLWFNRILIALGDYIQSDVIPSRNWGEVRLNTKHLETIMSPQEIEKHKVRVKFRKYVPKHKTRVSEVTKTKTVGGYKHTGLTREGFKASAAVEYYYDSYYLDKYREHIIRNTNKGMSKVRGFYNMQRTDSDYDEVSTAIVEDYLAYPYMMTQEDAYVDSRGRAIMQSLSRVANPVGYKDFRSLLTIPE